MLLNDIRFSLRLIRKNPVVISIAVSTLSLGIGATVIIFSVLYAAVLRPLPYKDATGLITIWQTHPTIQKLPIGALDYGDMRQQSSVFSDVAGYTYDGYRLLTLIDAGEPEQFSGVLVTGNLFPMLGIKPLVGRQFSEQEESDPSSRVVMLSERIWRQRFSADPAIVGQPVNLDGQSFTVVGVVRQQDKFPGAADLWLPVSQLTEQERTSRVVHALVGVGRLKPGATEQQAQTELDGIAERLEQNYPATNKTIRFIVSPFLDQFTGSVRGVLWVLLAAVALVLLIACANVANLILASGSARVQEIAVRSALGASRAVLIRQLITESLLLSLTGTAFGVLAAYFGLPVLKTSLLSSVARDVPRVAEASVNPLMMAFAAGIGLLTGIIFGIMPAFQISKTGVEPALRQESAGSVGRGRGRLRRILVVVEVALAVVVLIGSGLLVRSFQKVLRIDPGMRVDHVLTAHVLLPSTKYTAYPQVFSFYEQALSKIRALPSVEWASTVSNPPLTPSIAWTRFAIAGEPAPAPGRFPVAQSRSVSPDYFHNMGIPLERGREFTDADLHDFVAPPLIINVTLARRFFNETDPVGRQILLGVMTPSPTAYRICGVVADARDAGIDATPEAQIFFPAFGGSETLLIGTLTNPRDAARAVAGAVFEVDKDQPIDRVQTVDAILSDSLGRRRLSAVMMGMFSVLALMLASVGLYGVVSFGVSQRTREIGLRVALGADTSGLVRMVLLQGMAPVGVGLVIGVALAFGLTRIIASMLYGVSATDPLTFGATLSILAVVAALACHIPARRAARVDPAVALRDQ